jgi:hypothetical protein
MSRILNKWPDPAEGNRRRDDRVCVGLDVLSRIAGPGSHSFPVEFNLDIYHIFEVLSSHNQVVSVRCQGGNGASANWENYECVVKQVEL